MGCLNEKYPDKCTSFLLAKNYKPTWTKIGLRPIFVLRWKKVDTYELSEVISFQNNEILKFWAFDFVLKY